MNVINNQLAEGRLGSWVNVSQKESFRFRLLLLGLVFIATVVQAGTNVCEICGGPLGSEAFLLQDKVTMAKVQVCRECALSGTTCFFCGLPARKNTTELSDGRIICERDSAEAVLTKEEGLRICRDTRHALSQLFSASMVFPEKNVSVAMVDRVNLQELFRYPGNDYTCPNVWGYFRAETNRATRRFEISLLIGLPLQSFRATCAHEYGHAWLTENLPAARKKSISKDAQEGFCELIAFLLMDAENEEGQKQVIKQNNYTRGQIHLLIEAEQRYRINEVIRWVMYGKDDKLSADDPNRIRNIQVPTVTQAASQSVLSSAVQEEPRALTLKAIFWRPDKPVALINDQSFRPLQEAEMRLNGTNATVRCLEIKKDIVRILIVGTGEEKELRLNR